MSWIKVEDKFALEATPDPTKLLTVEELQAGQSAPQVTAKIEISNTESKANNYIDIYPYVKCETRQCKSTDDLSRGILDRGGEEDYITIKFQDATV